MTSKITELKKAKSAELMPRLKPIENKKRQIESHRNELGQRLHTIDDKITDPEGIGRK